MVDQQGEIKQVKPIEDESGAVTKSLTGVGGWLMLLCLMLIVIRPLGFIGALKDLKPLFYQENDLYRPIAQWLVLSGLLMIFGVVTGILLSMSKRIGVELAKLFFVLDATLWWVTVLLIPSYVSDQNTGDTLGTAATTSAIRATIFCVLWIAYLYKSKRVKNTYKL